MKLGVVGLPNVGKSTLFNAITKAGAQAANYPFWQDEEVAQMVDNAILNFLNAENVKYSTITGSTAERSQKILDIVGIKKEIVKPQSAIEAETK